MPKLKSLADKGAAIGAGEHVGLVIAVMLELHTLSPYTLKALADTLEGKVDDNEPVMIMGQNLRTYSPRAGPMVRLIS